MNLDDITPVAYPDVNVWTAYYEKFHDALIKSLNRKYCFADREDAVEAAFHKLMHLKDRDAYGDRLPRTEKEWFSALQWQARSKLSHLRERCERHAKYVEYASKELAGIFSSGFQDCAMDSDLRSRALVRALEMFRAEQDIPRRNLEIYVSRVSGIPAKDIADRIGITANNVDQIKYRMGILLRKHGPRCFLRALRMEAHYGWGCRSFSTAA